MDIDRAFVSFRIAPSLCRPKAPRRILNAAFVGLYPLLRGRLLQAINTRRGLSLPGLFGTRLGHALVDILEHRFGIGETNLPFLRMNINVNDARVDFEIDGAQGITTAW